MAKKKNQPPDPGQDMLGWLEWMLNNQPEALGPVLTPGAVGALPLPMNLDDANDVIDYGKDAADLNWKINEQLFSPESAIMRIAQYGINSVDPSAFAPTVTYDPLPISDMANVAVDANGQLTYGDPVYAKYLDPNYDVSGDAVGRIVQAVLAGQPMIPLINEMVAAADPNNTDHPLHELATSGIPPTTDQSGRIVPDVPRFVYMVEDAVEGAQSQKNFAGMDIGLDPVTGRPGFRTETPSELVQTLMAAGYADPTQPYDPNMWAAPEQLAVEDQVTQDWLGNQTGWGAEGQPTYSGGGMEAYRRLLAEGAPSPVELSEPMVMAPSAPSTSPGAGNVLGGFGQLADMITPGDAAIGQGALDAASGFGNAAGQLTDMVLGTNLGGSDRSSFALEGDDRLRLARGEVTLDDLRAEKGYRPRGVASPEVKTAAPTTAASVDRSSIPGMAPEWMVNEPTQEELTTDYQNQLEEYRRQWFDYTMAEQERERRNRISQGLYDAGYFPFQDQLRQGFGVLGAAGIPTPSGNVGGYQGGTIGDVSNWRPAPVQPSLQSGTYGYDPSVDMYMARASQPLRLPDGSVVSV